MSLTLDGIELPEDLYWSDEFTAWKVGQVTRRSLTGALIVQEAAMQAGRPVTLESIEDGNGNSSAWVRLSVLEQLRAREERAGAPPMTLVMPTAMGGTRSMQVLWRRSDGPALEVRPLRAQTPAAAEDNYLITLRLMQV